jgi:hypothetical protein
MERAEYCKYGYLYGNESDLMPYVAPSCREDCRPVNSVQ